MPDRIEIRTVRPDDAERLAEHFRALSPASSYSRFFGARSAVPAREIARIAAPSSGERGAVVATIGSGNAERIVGLAQYVVTGGLANMACSVLDRLQGMGIGRRLLGRLLALARANGVTEFESEVLVDNGRMLGLLHGAGLDAHRHVEEGIVHVHFSAGDADRALRAAA